MALSDYRLSAQSFSFRNCSTTAETIDAIQRCGLSAVELWKKHLDPLECPNPAEEIGRYHDAGIRISAFGVHGFDEDEAKARKVFEFARLAQLEAISASLPRENHLAILAMLERLGDEYDVNIAIHNHGRKSWHSLPFVRDDLMAATGRRIGLCLDTRWLLDTAEDPVAEVEKRFDRLYNLHLMDCVFGRDGRFQDVIPGTGNLDLPGLLALLRTKRYRGYMTFEYAGRDDPVGFIRQCIRAVEEAS